MMQTRTGRLRQRRKSSSQGCTAIKLRLCYGLPCAVLGVLCCLFLLLNSTFSHSDDDQTRADIQQIEQPWKSMHWDGISQEVTGAQADGEGPGDQQWPVNEAESLTVDSCLADFSQTERRPSPPCAYEQSLLSNRLPQDKADDDKNKPFENLEVQETGSQDVGTPPSIVELDIVKSAITLEAGDPKTKEANEFLSSHDSLSGHDSLEIEETSFQLSGGVADEASQVPRDLVSEESYPEPGKNFPETIPGDGSTKVCLIGDSGGADCQLQVSDGKTFTPLCTGSSKSPDGLTCSDESTLLKNICDVRDPSSLDVLTGEKTAEDFMLCLRDPVTGTATCEPLCSSSSRTTLSRSATGVCLCGSPLLDIIVNRPSGSHDVQSRSLKLSSQLSLGASRLEGLGFSGDLSEPAYSKVPGQGLGFDESAALNSFHIEDGVVAMQVAMDSDAFGGTECNQSGEKTPGAMAQEARSSRTGHVVSLDEYRRSIIDKKQGQQDSTGTAAASIHIRHQNRDSGYNYADSSHGAKLVACNKEAKGAGHILVSDKDKYLRNPCSAEDKFVVVELSEETLVDNFMIANFEFHSSNVKELELLGSPDVYPTEEWISLGKFEADNVRHPQKFSLAEPKWVRCLMLRLISHYGTEFYCTLSMLQIHGVDAIEHLLEDWIGEEGDSAIKMSSTANAAQSQNDSNSVEASESLSATQVAAGGLMGEASNGVPSSSLDAATTTAPALVKPVVLAEHTTAPEVGSPGVKGKEEESKWFVADTSQDVVPQHVQGGRPSGDSVMKILMQKVKSLELNQLLFDGYLEDLNQKYKEMFNDLDQDLSSLTTNLKSESAISSSLGTRLHEMEVKKAIETAALEAKIVRQLQQLNAEIEFMRSKLRHMEGRETLAMAMTILCLLVTPVLYCTVKCLSPRRMPRSRSRSPTRLSFPGQLQSYPRLTHSFDFPYVLLFLVSAFITLVLSV